MMRSVPAARRSLVTVSAMPDDNQANSRSLLTFSKSSTAIAGCLASIVGSTTGAAGTGVGIATSTAATKR